VLPRDAHDVRQTLAQVTNRRVAERGLEWTLGAREQLGCLAVIIAPLGQPGRGEGLIQRIGHQCVGILPAISCRVDGRSEPADKLVRPLLLADRSQHLGRLL